MRRLAYSTLAAVLAAGTAEAACNLDEAGLVERHASLAEERGRLRATAEHSLRAMRQTAETLDRNGYGAACDAVVDAAHQLLESEQAWADEAEPPARLPEQETGALNLHTFAASGTPVESAQLIGAAVFSTAGERLGEVEGVLLDQARDASHLVVAHGGLWGAGEREIAVPSERMLVDPETGRLYTEIGDGRLAEAPEYDRAAWDATANDAWYEAEAAEAVATSGARALEARTAEQEAADAAMAEPEPQQPPPAAEEDEAAPMARGGPKRIRVEKDRPESAQGSND